MKHLSNCKKIADVLPLSLVWLALSFLLSGCGSVQEGTPVVEKHAKRGYNKPYQINGTWYYPQGYYEYSEVGKASYYGGRDSFHGKKTSTGERFDKDGLTCAHKTMPLPGMVQVTNLENGRSLKLKVIDRGPFIDGRIIDVSSKAAKLLGFYNQGIAEVRVEALVGESIHLANNYNPNASRLQATRQPVRNLTTPLKRAPEQIGSNPILTAYHKPKLRPKTSPMIHQVAADGRRNTRLNGTFVQMGMFTTPEKAQKLMQMITQQYRVPVKTYRYKKNNQPIYRVLVGPLRSSESAKSLLNKVKSQGYRSAVVVYE